jgi:hypothetical protein
VVDFAGRYDVAEDVVYAPAKRFILREVEHGCAVASEVSRLQP